MRPSERRSGAGQRSRPHGIRQSHEALPIYRGVSTTGSTQDSAAFVVFVFALVTWLVTNWPTSTTLMLDCSHGSVVSQKAFCDNPTTGP